MCNFRSLRDTYGKDQTRNALHGSDNKICAETEIHFLFHDAIVEPISQTSAAKDYLTNSLSATLLKGMKELCKVKPADPVQWLADWLIENNPNKPKVGVTVVE